eukprot:7527677-Alexandrium_andersonii.AAC.1
MSASLVGSEMCIRDSPWSRSNQAEDPGPGAPGAWGQRNLATVGQGYSAGATWGTASCSGRPLEHAVDRRAWG